MDPDDADRLAALMEVDDTLTPWEREFLDRCDRWEGPLTEPMQDKLKEIYAQHIEGASRRSRARRW